MHGGEHGFTKSWEQAPGRRDRRVVGGIYDGASRPLQSRDRCNIVDHPPNQLQGSPLPSPAEHRRLSLLPPSRCVSTWVPPSSSEQASQRLSRRPTTPSTSSRRPTIPSTSSQRCRTRSRRSSRRMRSRGVAMGATWATSPSVGTGMFCHALLTCPLPPLTHLFFFPSPIAC